MTAARPFPSAENLRVAILLFDEVTALDAIGPYEVLARMPGAEVMFVASRSGPIRCAHGGLELFASESFAELPASDVLLVPGGPGVTTAAGDRATIEWLRTAHETSRWTSSVCTGALLLGAAGILSGRRATTHWLAMERLARSGATPVHRRVVQDGKVLTSAGVSAGIDMALVLAAELGGEETAKAIELSLEYDPAPPFGAGSPVRAGPDLVARVQTAAKRS